MEKNTKKLVIVLLCLITSLSAFAQSKSGLYFTPQEVEIWKARSKGGPYKSSGDAISNSPGDWSRILKSANECLANPTAEHYKGPTKDKYGKTTTVAVQWSQPEALTKGVKLRDAAFVYLLTNDSRYKNAVYKGLLAQAKEPLTDFSNITRWPVVYDINPGFDVAEWISRLLVAYDMIEISDPTIDRFFKNAGAYCYRNIQNLKSGYVDRERGILKITGNSTDKTHIGGYIVPTIGKWYNNRRATIERAVAMVGFKYYNAAYVKEAAMFFKEFIKYSIYPDGTFTEFHRATSSLPDKGFAYSTASCNIMIEIADLYARQGDKSLYNYVTSDGVNQTKGGQKSLKLMIQSLSKHINGTIKRYAISTSSSQNIIDGKYKTWLSENDIWFAQANVYYKDSYIKSTYTKAYVSSPATSGPLPVWGGTGGLFPGKLFMYGQLEGKVNPYSTTAAIVNTTPTVSAGADKNVTLPVSSVSIYGKASDSDGSISSYVWTKRSGGAVTLSNTTTSTLKLTNLVAGTYVFRLTVKDNSGLSAYDEVKVTATAPTSLPITEEPITDGPTFYRGINLNGPAITIDGNSWEAGTSTGNFSFSGRTYENQAIALNPSTDASKSKMLRSAIWRLSGYNNVSFSVKDVPEGLYETFVYIWEDNYATSFDLYLEGVKIKTVTSGGKGAWKKVSLGEKFITDGAIDVKAAGGDALLSGVEIQIKPEEFTSLPITEDPYLPITEEPAFYRAININGPALSIDGESWEAGSSSDNFTFSGRTYENQSLALNPTADASQSKMLRSAIWRLAGNNNVSFSVKDVPDGLYETFVYVWEDNYSTTFDLFLEGTRVGEYSSGDGGSWKRISLGEKNITDGAIDIRAVGGDVLLSGIRIVRLTEDFASLPITEGPAFYRAVNINGPSLAIDGNTWESGKSNGDFTFSGRAYENQTITLNPSTDANKSKMVRSAIWRLSDANNVSFSVKEVPAGIYETFVYVWEDNNATSFDFFLEGSKVGEYSSGNGGSWKRISLGEKYITDGAIDVRAVGGDVLLSGIEIWKISGTSSARLASPEAAFDESEESSLKVYPNPFVEEVTLELSQKEMNAMNLSVSILDYSGHKVKSEEVMISSGQSDIQLTSLGALESGTYLVEIKSETSQRVVRVIKL